jgi:hypothetical protein
VSSSLRPLNDGEIVALQQGLALASQMARSDSTLDLVQVQQLYDAALDSNERDVERLIAIGLAFGALIVDGAEFEWARISDEWGDETCVGVIGKMTHCAPISMIQKRLRRAETIDVAELRGGTIRALREQAAQAADR